MTIIAKESCGVKFKETQYIGVGSNGDNKIKVIARLIKCTNLIVSVDKWGIIFLTTACTLHKYRQ
ncbi:MAG TPA: hypothetical protein DEV59_00680 [Proteus sp.]|nr:hypothetical protein [Proteus sp. (in: enterobacteria)]